jgi:hypothetical protein
MVPNFLNLPVLIWGMGAPRDVLGLAMYASSRAAGCAYCSAHTCSFALRRGASAAKVAAAAGTDLVDYTSAERAAVAMAGALSTVPPTFTAVHREELTASFAPADAEWIFLGVAMMGFLNKFMDALGVDLEGTTVEEVRDVIAPSGWSPGKHGDGGARPSGAPPRPDGLATKLGILRYAPGALSLDKKWTAGVPDRWPRVGEVLRERTGHDFPVLAKLTHRRAVRALATMLLDNLDPKTSVIGIAKKLEAGAVFARAIGDELVEAQLRKLGASERDVRVEALARAIAPSPAVVDEGVVDTCRDLPPAALVEVVAFVSLVQLWHRVETFYAA